MKITLFFLFILFSLSSKLSLAYPNYIGHGYTSCLNCHYNPFGNGPLNDYGRAVSATLISARWAYPKTWTEEDLAEKSGTLFRKPKQDWFRTQFNYRRFRLTRNPGSAKNETELWLTMQADARAIIKFGENDKFTSVVNYGYAPAPLSQVSGVSNQDSWRSREHYIGYKINPKVGVYAGLMDKVYGVRLVEHIAFSRSLPQVTMNDQAHGIAVHYLNDKWEGGINGFLGNLSQEENLRMKGGSTMVERTVGDIHRIGASYMSSRNKFYYLQSYSLHTRLNLKDGASIIAELGEVQKNIDSTQSTIKSRYGLLQTYLRPTRGFYVLNNIEYAKADTSDENYIVRWGPAIQIFPAQRIELRGDIYNTRVFGPETSVPDNWTLLLQTHLWL
jgi:hypothetical protein